MGIIYLTKRVDAPVWKSSLLATIESRRSSDMQDQTLKNIERQAEQEYVQLISAGHRWRLVLDGEPDMKRPTFPET